MSNTQSSQAGERTHVKIGDVVRFLPEWQDEGDEEIVFIAVTGDEGGRVTVEAQLGLPINPQQRVDVSMLV